MDRSLFRKLLFTWYKQNKRTHPWINHRDPYKIWLYEIIMQQTRISQGTPYYERFVEQYPTVAHLAKAEIDDILKLWQGLGYYSRARNLHHAANQIIADHNGKFPQTSQELLKLKGIGSYTSAAIATFAFDEKVGVVDGNVYRVLARVFGIKEPMDQTQGKKSFDLLAQELVDDKKPALYNQALMDFGATQCTPKQAHCTDCVMKSYCFAFQKDVVYQLPLKSKKLTKKTRYFNYLVMDVGLQTIIRQRVEKDVWQLLYEYPYIEKKAAKILTKQGISKWLVQSIGYEGRFTWKRQYKVYKQQLTHQTIIGTFYGLELQEKPALKSPYKLVIDKGFRKHAFPKIIDCYLSDNSISLFK